MLHPALDIIASQLKDNGIEAELGNIGEILASNNLDVQKNIIISLINIEENRISRDPRNYVRIGTEIKIKNAAIHLNLTLLFTSVSSGYTQALVDVQQVVGFFQNKYVFDHSNTLLLDPGIDKLILEMLSLNLEQLQQLWSMLGGKYHPSVAYRMRMVTIDSQPSNDDLYPIKEINATYHLK